MCKSENGEGGVSGVFEMSESKPLKCVVMCSLLSLLLIKGKSMAFS